MPLAGSSVPAGFPSPAEDYIDRALDFNELLIENAEATFAVHLAGGSMFVALAAMAADGEITAIWRMHPLQPAHPGDGA